MMVAQTTMLTIIMAIIVFDKVTLRPWKFYKPKKHAKYIIETEKNKLNLKIGDKLDFL